jgi:surfeit locus 1 family protein
VAADQPIAEPIHNERRADVGWPPVLPTFVTLVAVALFVVAGNWQRARFEAKEALRAQIDSASAAMPVAMPANVDDWASWRFRPVIATGRFDPQHQILIDNRVHQGSVGFDVVTLLRLDDGRMALVNRGFVAGGPSRDALPNVPPPDGVVAVRGRINIAADHYFELSHETPTGSLWQHLEPRRYAAATGLPILPIVIESTAPIAGETPLIRDWPAPDFGIERHRIYMVQWYTFAALALLLWAWFVLRPRLFKP